jgi:hypothetical protein
VSGTEELHEEGVKLRPLEESKPRKVVQPLHARNPLIFRSRRRCFPQTLCASVPSPDGGRPPVDGRVHPIWCPFRPQVTRRDGLVVMRLVEETHLQQRRHVRRSPHYLQRTNLVCGLDLLTGYTSRRVEGRPRMRKNDWGGHRYVPACEGGNQEKLVSNYTLVTGVAACKPRICEPPDLMMTVIQTLHRTQALTTTTKCPFLCLKPKNTNDMQSALQHVSPCGGISG